LGQIGKTASSTLQAKYTNDTIWKSSTFLDLVLMTPQISGKYYHGLILIFLTLILCRFMGQSWQQHAVHQTKYINIFIWHGKWNQDSNHKD